MNYIDLNKHNRNKAKGCYRSESHFEWEDKEFMQILKGKIPDLRYNTGNNEADKCCFRLSQKLKEYDFYNTDHTDFIAEIQDIITSIRSIVPYWSEFDVVYLDDILKHQKFCLISGEGGIGKSYFIKCLEEELEAANIKHLCIYGKFLKDINDIDFDEIALIGEKEEFVFAFDAINEISEENQILLARKIEDIKSIRGIRIIITFRSYMIKESIYERYSSLAENTYVFSGVSFESVLEWLQTNPIIDINEYVDVLFSHNPFLLSKLPIIFDKPKDELNNITRYTYIYENYIKKSLTKEIWDNTKKIFQYLFNNNKKSFSLEEIKNSVDSPMDYVLSMKQKGFIETYSLNDIEYHTFTIEALADYLLARCLFDELNKDNISECIARIIEKRKKFYDLSRETIIIMVFDKFAPDYNTIRIILEKTELIDDFELEILSKIHFLPQNIPLFLDVFHVSSTEELFIHFAGYINKPYNCTNYLNTYYLEDVQRQTSELSIKLSGKYLTSFKRRLKNILYFICKCNCNSERMTEYFYMALWSTSACNSDIRNLALKLLFEILQRNPEFIETAIFIFDKIQDDYIRDAIIYVLSSCKQNTAIVCFFEKLICNTEFFLSKSIRRICRYLGRDYDYINFNKRNLFDDTKTEVTEDFIQMLHRVDLYEKELLPFRCWGIDNFEPNTQFITVDKNIISQFNDKLIKECNCVKCGECNGSMRFRTDIEKYFSVSYADSVMAPKSVLASMECVFMNTFSKYGLAFEYTKSREQNNTAFECSLFRKCVCISIDLFYGSLMSNYYTNEFGTYNNLQNSIGYEVYDPLEDGEILNIKSPLSVYQPKVEQMGDSLVKKLEVPERKNEAWWKDINISKRNIIALLQPIIDSGYEWILLSGRIAIQDSPEITLPSETYNIYVCCSEEEHITDDGNARYLTIEIDTYDNNLYEYEQNKKRPHLCKRVPTLAYSTETFDDTWLMFPPSIIISSLSLKLKMTDMCWYNEDEEKVIICNNNKSSYYQDCTMGTIFMRKDIFDQLHDILPIKYFVFTEKYLEGHGYCDETDYHYEIKDNKFIREVPNRSYRGRISAKENAVCEDCRFGFNNNDETSPLREYLNLIKEYGISAYITGEDELED